MWLFYKRFFCGFVELISSSTNWLIFLLKYPIDMDMEMPENNKVDEMV